MHQAGFHMAAALEYDPDAAMTYTVNLGRPPERGGVHFHFDTDERGMALAKAIAEQWDVKIDADGYVLPDQHAKGLAAPGRHRASLGMVGSGWIAGQPPGEPGCEHFWIADARNVTGAEILDALDLEVGDVDVVVGGPPCQGYSNAGKRQVLDPRNSLVFEFARLILEIQPRTFVMENVPGMATMVTPEGVGVVDAFCQVIADGGFGTYDALRRSLLTSAGAGAALRGKATSKTARKGARQPTPAGDADELDHPIQGSLLEEVSA
jgi:DNA (cytosine-5)-methyltransferase 1